MVSLYWTLIGDKKSIIVKCTLIIVIVLLLSGSIHLIGTEYGNQSDISPDVVVSVEPENIVNNPDASSSSIGSYSSDVLVQDGIMYYRSYTYGENNRESYLMGFDPKTNEYILVLKFANSVITNFAFVNNSLVVQSALNQLIVWPNVDNIGSDNFVEVELDIWVQDLQAWGEKLLLHADENYDQHLWIANSSYQPAEMVPVGQIASFITDEVGNHLVYETSDYRSHRLYFLNETQKTLYDGMFVGQSDFNPESEIYTLPHNTKNKIVVIPVNQPELRFNVSTSAIIETVTGLDKMRYDYVRINDDGELLIYSYTDNEDIKEGYISKYNVQDKQYTFSHRIDHDNQVIDYDWIDTNSFIGLIGHDMIIKGNQQGVEYLYQGIFWKLPLPPFPIVMAILVVLSFKYQKRYRQ